MHQITAYAGGPTGDGKELSVPFQQAIPQSPGWYPTKSDQENEATYEGFLNATGCDDITCLRSLSTEDVIKANNLTVFSASYGSYLYGPVPDGSLVPDLPGLLLRKGKFARQVKLLIGHNIDVCPSICLLLIPFQ
jgi:carboxylesterase type B